MQVRTNRTNEVTQQVEVEIEEQKIQSATARKLREMAAKVKIDGFRPGKAPAEVVRKRHGAAARMEAIEDIVNRSVYEALQTDGLDKTIQFSRPEVKAGFDGGNVVFTFDAENFPHIDPKDYKGVAVELLRTTVDAEEVDAEIEKLREGLTQLAPVEDRTTVQANDVVRVNYRALGEGPQAEMAEDDQEIDLSRTDLLPGVSTGMVGAEKGAKHIVQVTLPEEFPLDELKNAGISLEIEVLDILARQAPALDDAFAKETGKADTLDALRAKIEADLRDGRVKSNENSAKNRILDVIGAANTVQVPPMYLAMQSQQQVMEQLQMFEKQGIDWRNMKLDVNMLLDASKRDMEPSLARSLVMQAIAREQDITVSDEEVQAEVDRMAAERNEPAARIIAQLGGEDALDQIRFRKQMDRVLDFVWSAATITEVDALTEAAEESADGEEA